MAKGQDRKVADVAHVLGRLKIGGGGGGHHGGGSHGHGHGRGHGHSRAASRVHRDASLLESILDADGDAMEVDTNYPMLVLISDLMLGHAVGGSSRRASGVVSRLASLVRQCAIPTDLQYTYLRHFRAAGVGALLFGQAQEAVSDVLRLALRHASLYIAVIAVGGLHHARSASSVPAASSGDTPIYRGGGGLDEDDVLQGRVTLAYRLRQRAQSLLLHREKEAESAGHAGGMLPTLQESREAYLLTSACLLLFDALTGNLDAWRARLTSTRMWLRDLGHGSHMARLIYPTVTLHERIVRLLVEDDLSDELEHGAPRLFEVQHRDELDRRIAGPSVFDEDAALSADSGHAMSDRPSIAPSKLTLLHSELERTMVLATDAKDENDVARLERRLDRWRERFPLSLQLLPSWAEVADSTCFYPGLTCASPPTGELDGDGGNTRAVTLHVLYCECVVRLLLAGPNVHARNKVHEQVVTACKLMGSVAIACSGGVTDSMGPSVAMTLAPALYIAGKHVFSSSARAWVLGTMRRWADESGIFLLDRMADALERRHAHDAALASAPTHIQTMPRTRTDDDDGDVIDLD